MTVDARSSCTFSPTFIVGSRKPCETNSLSDLIDRTLVTAQAGRRKTAVMRLLVITDHLDATVEISFLKPLREIDSDPSIDVLSGSDLDRFAQMSFRSFDVLLERLRPTHMVFSRYTGQHFDNLYDLAKSRNIVTVCYLDDDLLNIPSTVGKEIQALFSGDSIRRTLSNSISKSDLMLCSTPQLLKAISPLRAPEQLTLASKINRSVSDAELSQIPELSNSDTFTIGYMASSSHIEDFRAWMPDVIRFLTDHPDARMAFFGSIQPPKELGVFGKRIIRHAKASSYPDFMSKLRLLNWDVGLAPLLDNAFNRNKTLTKWVEYTLAGIPTLASPLAPYEKPIAAGGCYPIQNSNLYETLSQMARSKDLSRSLMAKARQILELSYHVQDHVIDLTNTLAKVPAKPSSGT